MPEALTKWKFLGFAHTPDCKNGLLTDFVVTRKELMVQPNPPRFLREGDTLLFSAKVVNMSDKELSGAVRLEFKNALNDQAVDAALGLQNATQSFTIAAGASSGFTWTLKVPLGMGPLAYTVVAKAESFSDGEAGTVPVLPSRIFLTESVPLHIRGPETKDFTFDRLKQIGASDTMEPFRLTVQVASNPAWYAIQALPYLIEFPHECSEQVFNRLYANSLARHIANSDPEDRADLRPVARHRRPEVQPGEERGAQVGAAGRDALGAGRPGRERGQAPGGAALREEHPPGQPRLGLRASSPTCSSATAPGRGSPADGPPTTSPCTSSPATAG